MARRRTNTADRPSGPDDSELSELDALGTRGTWNVFGRELSVTNLDKRLFPGRNGDDPVTKRDLIRYAGQIAPTVTPYLSGRAVNLHRYPDGIEQPGFWHKERPDHAPKWLSHWVNEEADPGETHTYVVGDEPAAVVWMANFGAIEWHPWTSTTEHPHQPSYALIDLDRGEHTTWEELLILARLHRTALEHVGVRGYPKITGRSGIQIWVPVVDGYTFEDTRDWVNTLSRTVGRVVPDLVSWKWEVSERRGRARLDYTQNAINKTLVAPYSPRPTPGATVSAPISWDELEDESLRPDRYDVRNIAERIDEYGDRFAPMLDDQQELPPLT